MKLETFDGLDVADITVFCEGGLVQSVDAPKGLSVLVIDYDTEGEQDPSRLALDANGDKCAPRWFKEPGEANFEPVPGAMPLALLREAIEYDQRAFETNDHVNGANLCEWFGEFRERAKAALGGNPWEGAAEPFLKKYNVEAVPERCLLVMVGQERDTITEKDVELLLDASGWGGVDEPMTREQLGTWPAMWFKKAGSEVTGFFIATTDEDAAAEDPEAFMAGASPALRNLWRDARAAGFTRIELTID